MPDLSLHHVSAPTRDLDRAAKFYEGVLRLTRIARPPFAIPGVWYGLGDRQIHVTLHPTANFRDGKPVDNNDVHFALRVDDFETWQAHLARLGYDAALPDDHPMRLIVRLSGPAGYPQIYLMDPDRNVIELNGPPFPAA